MSSAEENTRSDKSDSKGGDSASSSKETTTRRKDRKKKKSRDKTSSNSGSSNSSKPKEIVTARNSKDEEYLIAGTIEAIVNWLLEQVELMPEESERPAEKEKDKPSDEPQQMIVEHKAEVELNVFIISYRQFVSPTGFFGILAERFRDNADPLSRNAVLKMLKVWILKYLERDFFFRDKGNRLFDEMLRFLNEINHYGYRDESNKVKLLILRVKAKKHLIVAPLPPVDRDTKEGQLAMRGTLEAMMEQKKRYSSNAQAELGALAHSVGAKQLTRSISRGADGSQITPPGMRPSSKPLALCEMPLIELGEQLTLIELKMFKAIREREFLNLNWKKADHKRNARHIVKMVERFNKVSYWVATRIVRETDLKKRTSLLKRFIILADKSAELNNFNTLMEVLAGLNLYPIQRLKQTWGALSDKYKETMERLENLMENKQNYKNYRERLTRIKQNGEPVLPYLGVYLRDLTFIDEGNMTYTEDKLVNYEKIQLVGQVIREVQHFQEHSFYQELQLTDVPSTIKYLKKLRGLKQDELDKKSREVEPPPITQSPSSESVGGTTE